MTVEFFFYIQQGGKVEWGEGGKDFANWMENS